MQKTVGIISLGCPKNLVDTEVMLGLLEKEGWHVVTDPHKAGMLIVNTCSFIEDAKRESIEAILEMAGAKNRGDGKRLIVTGCMPERYKEELIELFPEVDLFIGVNEYPQIVNLVNNLDSKKRSKLNIGSKSYLYTSKTPRKIASGKHAVYVKIAEGCFHNCSFCAIPWIRGKYRSRQPKDIVLEVKGLLRGGAKEINLIAQDTTAYGRDLAEKTDLAALLSDLGALSGEKWIRFMYAYPQTFKKSVIRAMKETPDICRYVDIPIQHIDDGILFNMRRGRSEEKIRSLVAELKNEMPDVSLRTAVITGFPGEGKKEFKKLLRFIEDGWFDHVGVFTYSEEEGTAAAHFKGHVSEKEKEERKKELMLAQKSVSAKKLRGKIGSRIKVLVESVHDGKNSVYQGRAAFQAPDIDGVVYVNGGKVETGLFYWVEIIDSYDYDLGGRLTVKG